MSIGFICYVSGRTDPTHFFYNMVVSFDSPPALAVLKETVEDRVLQDDCIPDGSQYFIGDFEVLDFRVGMWVTLESKNQLYSGCQLNALRSVGSSSAAGMVDRAYRPNGERVLRFAVEAQSLFEVLDTEDTGELRLPSFLKVFRANVDFAIDAFTQLDRKLAGFIKYRDFLLMSKESEMEDFFRELRIRIETQGKRVKYRSDRDVQRHKKDKKKRQSRRDGEDGGGDETGGDAKGGGGGGTSKKRPNKSGSVGGDASPSSMSGDDRSGHHQHINGGGGGTFNPNQQQHSQNFQHHPHHVMMGGGGGVQYQGGSGGGGGVDSGSLSNTLRSGHNQGPPYFPASNNSVSGMMGAQQGGGGGYPMAPQHHVHPHHEGYQDPNMGNIPFAGPYGQYLTVANNGMMPQQPTPSTVPNGGDNSGSFNHGSGSGTPRVKPTTSDAVPPLATSASGNPLDKKDKAKVQSVIDILQNNAAKKKAAEELRQAKRDGDDDKGAINRLLLNKLKQRREQKTLAQK